jgi:hypothetical protein
MSASVSPPTATPKQTDPASGFALMQQPIALHATSPILADGTPLTSKDPTTGKFVMNPSVAKAGFTFGAVVYRNTSGTIEIYDGSGWGSETAFDADLGSATLTPFAYAAANDAWTGTFLFSSLANSSDPAFLTASGQPKYGFIAVFMTPKTSPTTSIRSALGAPIGVAGSDSTLQVQPGLVSGTTPTQNPKNADGFAVFVNNAAQVRVADLIVSSNTTLPQTVMLRFYSGGVERASIAIEPSGNVHLTSATQITLEAPTVTVSGTLEANTVSYVPYGGTGTTFL